MLWFAPSYLEHKAAIQEGVMNFVPYLNSLERVGTVLVESIKKVPQKLVLVTQVTEEIADVVGD